MSIKKNFILLKRQKLVSNLKKNNFGFTLIELLVVVVIIGIFASFSRPAFQSSLKNQRLRSSRRLIISIIRRAKRTAVMENRNVYVGIKLGEFNNYNEREQVLYIRFADEDRFLDSFYLPSQVKIIGIRKDNETGSGSEDYYRGTHELLFSRTGTQPVEYFIWVTYYPNTFNDRNTKSDEFFTIRMRSQRGQLPRVFDMYSYPDSS